MYYLCRENKGADQLAITTKLICVFVFAFAKCWFSHGTAQMLYVASERYELCRQQKQRHCTGCASVVLLDIKQVSLSTRLIAFLFFPDLLKVAPGMPDGMTFDVGVKEESEVDKVKVTGTDPTILSLEDIMTLDDDLDLGLDEDESMEDNNETEKVCLPLLFYFWTP